VLGSDENGGGGRTYAEGEHGSIVETVRSGKELGVKVESVLEGIMEESGVFRMEREKEREREREKERGRGKEVERDWLQTGQLSREKQKERDTKESSTTTTTELE
jgi:hypothetical protein